MSKESRKTLALRQERHPRWDTGFSSLMRNSSAPSIRTPTPLPLSTFRSPSEEVTIEEAERRSVSE